MAFFDGLKEVDFEKYCKLCKHKDKEDYEDPCDDCLCHAVNYQSHKPVCFKEDEKNERK